MSEIASPIITVTAAHLGPSSAIAHRDPKRVAREDQSESKPKPGVREALACSAGFIPGLEEAHLPQKRARDRELNRDHRLEVLNRHIHKNGSIDGNTRAARGASMDTTSPLGRGRTRATRESGSPTVQDRRHAGRLLAQKPCVALVEHARVARARRSDLGLAPMSASLRAVGPAVLEAVLLAEGAYLDQAPIGRIRRDGEAEREGHYRTSHTASVNA
jgi:hypothetical protein